MKKSIIILGVAFIAFTGQSFASNVPASSIKEITVFTNSPLCAAIVKGDLETVKKFIEYGADVNEGYNGKTPLMYAARYNRVEIVELLLAKGANKSVEDEAGLRAFNYAKNSNATAAMELLK